MLGWRAGGVAHLPVLLVWKKLFNYVKEVTQWAAWVHKTEETKKKKKQRGREKEREERERTNKQMNNGVFNEKNVMRGPEPRAWGCVEDEDNEQEEEECSNGTPMEIERLGPQPKGDELISYQGAGYWGLTEQGGCCSCLSLARNTTLLKQLYV